MAVVEPAGKEMQRGGRITAIDIGPGRLKRMAEQDKQCRQRPQTIQVVQMGLRRRQRCNDRFGIGRSNGWHRYVFPIFWQTTPQGGNRRAKSAGTTSSMSQS